MTEHALRPSEEGDREGLALGRAQGEALGQTLRHMIENVADEGQELACGEYLIGYAVEAAEGLYISREGGLEWQEPDGENVHVEIAVRDAADGRFIPALDVIVTISEQGGAILGSHTHPLLWHPYVYHYGRNWHLPKPGRYRINVRFRAPTFARHDRKNGNRFREGAEITFDGVWINPTSHRSSS